MKSKRHLYSLLFCLLCICSAQETFARKARGANGFPVARIMRKTFGVSFSVPEGFNFRNEQAVLKIHENAKVGSFYYSLESDDAQCKLFWDEILLYYPDGPGHSHENPPPGFTGRFYGSDLSHRNSMWFELTGTLGVENVDLDDYISVVAGEEVGRRFNADSVFTYDVPGFVPIADIPKYEYCTRMYISRKGRPMLQLIWLFTREGKKNEEQYIRQLDGRVWYDDDWEPRTQPKQSEAERKYMRVVDKRLGERTVIRSR